MGKHRYVVEVSAETEAQALRVIGERLGHDEDYGFGYSINIKPLLIPAPGGPKLRGLEVLSVRDPDGPNEMAYFLDGERVYPDAEEHVDPGWGYPLDKWREDTEYTRNHPLLTPAFREAVIAARDAAESSPYITE